VTFTKTIEAVWDGGMRFTSQTGSGHEVRADDGESDAGPRPTELVLAGLVMCTAMDIVSILDKKRQDYERYLVHLTAVQREDYPQVFTRIDLVHEVVGPGVTEAAVRRCIQLSATTYCPVSAMLAMGETEIHHGYRVENTGAEPFTAEGEVIVTGPHWVPPAAT
jgi:putative redox protein